LNTPAGDTKIPEPIMVPAKKNGRSLSALVSLSEVRIKWKI
jgi:hypothetical protein